MPPKNNLWFAKRLLIQRLEKNVSCIVMRAMLGRDSDQVLCLKMITQCGYDLPLFDRVTPDSKKTISFGDVPLLLQKTAKGTRLWPD